MKHLLTLLLLSSCIVGKGQNLNFNSRFCGTWTAKPDSITPWAPKDTLGVVKTDKREWVQEKEWNYPPLGPSKTVYCPCGCPDDIIRTQKRVCRLTGIIQERRKITAYTYTPPPLSTYEQVVDSIKRANTPPDTASRVIAFDSVLSVATVKSGEVLRWYPVQGGSIVRFEEPEYPGIYTTNMRRWRKGYKKGAKYYDQKDREVKGVKQFITAN